MRTASKQTRKPRPKPERKLLVVAREVEVLTIRLTIGDEVTDYDVCRGVVADRYPVYLWRKVLPTVAESVKVEPYSVDVGGEFGDSCTCKGATYHGHCKHISATKALIEAGKLSALHE